MKRSLLSLVMLIAALSGKAQVVIGSQDFNGGLKNWTSVDNSSSGAKWIKATNPLSLVNYNPVAMNGPTVSTGYAAVVADGVQGEINTDLISPAYDFTGVDYAYLEFYEWLGIANVQAPPTAQVFASVDNGAHWVLVYDVVNATTLANGELMQTDISAVVANQASVKFKFSYQALNDVFWLVDDIRFITMPAVDATISRVDAPQYSPITEKYQVKCTVKNTGANDISGVTMNYSIDGGAPVSATLNALLKPFESVDYTFTTKARVSEPGEHIITVYTTAPNNVLDDNVSNDSLSSTVNFLDHYPARNILVEEFSTAPCGYCPGGAVFLEMAMEGYEDKVIAVSHHAGYQTDPMTITEHSTLSSSFGTSAPQASIDRVVFNGAKQINMGVPNLLYVKEINPWRDAIKARKDAFVPMALQANNIFNKNTRELIVNISSTFFASMSGDLRVNCYVVEDSIIGANGSGYDQLSYYYSSPDDLNINPWYHVGQSLGGGNAIIRGYVHNKVTRRFLGGTWGTAGVIPSKDQGDSVYTQTYTTTIPNDWNPAHLSLVAFVSNYSSSYSNGNNQVVNAVRMELNGYAENAAPKIVLSGIDEVTKNTAKMSIAPNPVADKLNINYSFDTDARISFEVYNAMGQLVSAIGESKMGKGDYTTTINTEKFENGVYFLTMKGSNNLMQTMKFVVAK